MKRLGLCVVVVLLAATIAPAGEPVSPRGWLGLRFHLEPAGAGRSAAFLFIESVVAGGPADRAGLRKQDLIVELGAKPIAFRSDLEALQFFATLRAGQKVRATVVRNQEKRAIVMTAIAPPDGARAAWDANMTRATAPKRVH